MGWLFRVLAGPMLWAILFAAVYALHGIGCARGWPAIATPLGNLHLVAMALLWLTGLALHVLILLRLPQGTARAEHLPRLGAGIGLVATLLTLSPVILISTCG
ncbi:hypothetical protein [Szabonella alba]|uniref:Uncharacterized protein n=1 Tax=Szabonella alba TaxID=2804194 RepID=A0A8K0V9S2_9RHOB|nr:hypothetical protein [Szabonella alba]MBL4917001.1 hypothetical protein [Szabonella alba]